MCALTYWLRRWQPIAHALRDPCRAEGLETIYASFSNSLHEAFRRVTGAQTRHRRQAGVTAEEYGTFSQCTLSETRRRVEVTSRLPGETAASPSSGPSWTAPPSADAA